MPVTQDWSNFSTKILKHFDREIILFEAQTEAQNIQFAIHESISVYGSRVEVLVNKNGLSSIQKWRPWICK